MKPLVVAFHLPQFHRIPENDRWWGEGYTEWVKVKAARALFPQHHQPRVPHGGRYYDMLNVETLAWQQELARAHGIGAFCYYHYWFSGRELLERPLDLLLNSPALDFPFCLSWANEPWTRAWDGKSSTVLIEQHYGGEAEWRSHIKRLIPFFSDRRYLRVDGRPVFLIYRTAAIERLESMVACWHSELEAAGLPHIYLISMETGFSRDERSHVFDARVDFEPMYTLRYGMSFWHEIKKKLRTALFLAAKIKLVAPFVRRRVRYSELWEAILDRKTEPHRFLGAVPDWDNTPRRGVDGIVLDGASPERFGQYFSRQYRRSLAEGHPLLFVNAWNEWSEGAYLEPDEHHGCQWLEEIQRVVDSST